MEMKGLPDEPTLFIWTYLNVRDIHCLRCTGRYTVRIQFLLLPLSYETSTSSPTQNTVFQSIFKTIFKERYPSFGDRVKLDLKFMLDVNVRFCIHLSNGHKDRPWTVSQRRSSRRISKEVRVRIHFLNGTNQIARIHEYEDEHLNVEYENGNKERVRRIIKTESQVRPPLCSTCISLTGGGYMNFNGLFHKFSEEYTSSVFLSISSF